LASAGISVTVGSDTAWSAPLWSRFCTTRIRYPSPVDRGEEFLAWLRRHVAETRYDVLLPLSDYTTVRIVTSQVTLGKFVGLAVPGRTELRRAHDKLEMTHLAEELGIGVPKTWAPRNRDELGRVAEEVVYPCVFKLRRGAGALGLAFPCSREELLAAFDGLAGVDDEVFSSSSPLIQEAVPGEVHDGCALFCRGEMVAGITTKRLYMLPREGGIGIVSESTHEPEVLEASRSILTALNWHGPANVEFKRDSRDGELKLLDLNARFWGVLDLSVQAGVDFPVLTARMATEGHVTPTFDYRAGLRYRFPIPYGVRQAFRNGNLLDDLWTFLGPARNTCSDLQIKDPVPTLIQCLRPFKQHL